MKLLRGPWAVFFATLAALFTLTALAFALEPGRDGYYHTGDAIRTKSVAFLSVKVYAIGHDMKQLPPAKSKQAVIDIDCDKRITWKMLRDVPADKIQNALREAYAMNGYGDGGKIGQAVSVFQGELKEGTYVTFTYDTGSKNTTVRVLGAGGSAVTIPGVDFMKGTWSIWFAKIDQSDLGDRLISRL